ncbi:MAG: hypothetical protein IT438_12675 [Phycisphaerales bacterium]|nr:hypothetical protein [Phycisphaerales bacterium]
MGEFLRLGVCALGFGLLGCAAPRADLRARLEDPQPIERIRAVATVTEQRRTELIPALVDRLDDADVAVRLYTIIGLEKLTGTRLGYDYAADMFSRRDAVLRWRRAVATGEFRTPDGLAQGEARGSTQDAGDGPASESPDPGP